jgi:uncharacterized integral membrane protein
MKYIKIVLFTTIVMILVLFAVRNQGKVNFVLGYKTTFTRGAEVGEDVKKDVEIKEEAGDEATAPVNEALPGGETGVDAAPPEEMVAPESVALAEPVKAPREIGYEREFEIPLFLLVFIEAFILMVLMSLVGVFEDISLRARIRELTRENKKLKSELNIFKKDDREPQKTKVVKPEAAAKLPETKVAAEKKPEKEKKETKKKSFLKSIKGEKKTPPAGSEDKGL